MARILLVEDDRDQRELRRMLLQHFGHDVDGCTMPLEAEAACATQTPDVVVMDLRLPEAADGRGLVRALRSRHPALPIIVVTGWADDLEGTPERASVQAVMRKPIKSEELVKLISQFTMKALFCLCLFAQAMLAQETRFPFEWSGQGEALATVSLSAPGADWSVAGREGAIAEIRIDGGAPQHVVVASGDQTVAHRLFLGPVTAGKHVLTVSAVEGLRVQAKGAQVTPVDPAREEGLALLHAPVLFARANTLGKWSDVPLVAYATSGREQSLRWFEYTVVFSNEDGGTSTRNLMARWGRAADIEYVYKVWLDESGRRVRTQIQTRDHKDVPYEGDWYQDHPQLVPVTDNNMVESARTAGQTRLRFQLAPELLALASGSREAIMDRHPWIYRVVADELKREKKLRPPLSVDGERIADPRNYLVVEFRGRYRTSALQVLVRLKDDSEWRGSSVGLPENFINRPEFTRVAIELPPGAAPGQIAELGFQCMLMRDARIRSGPSSGECRVEALGRVFLPGPDAAPGASLQPAFTPMTLRTGDLRAIPLP